MELIEVRPLTTSAFDLPDRLHTKADPKLIADDERHFAAIAHRLEQLSADLAQRLDAARKAPAGKGRRAVDRDQEVRRLTVRLRALRRFGLDLCLGRMVPDPSAADRAGAGGDSAGDDVGPVYVGRQGLTDDTGRQLLLDWRSPAAAPFFGATHGNPMGLASRRRYRWTMGRISDYWDEVFAADALDGHAALDDQSAFIASLGGHRSDRMRDVLATIAADQDAIIRAGSAGALVVDGGPGTGKTVVALHRTAYLRYHDPRLGQRRGGVLFVGPHRPYLAYVADVLPHLGEDDVQTCTLADLVAEGATATVEPDPEVARIKSSARWEAAVEAAIRFYEEPPPTATTVATGWTELTLTPDDWADAFAAPGPGVPHNEAREQIMAELLTILVGRYEGDEPDDRVRAALEQNQALRTALHRAWPLLDAADIVADLWSVPAYLRRCAPWLDPVEIRLLQRTDARAWTVADLPLLDAARLRLGDARASERERRHRAEVAVERVHRARVIDDLLDAHSFDDGEGVLAMLYHQDLRETLIDETGGPDADPDALAGPFAHVVVDEAQELTDAQWQMLLRRCPSRSFTIVGDRAQARHGFTESWPDRLARVGLDRVEVATLTVNYRTPAEIMAYAEPVIRAALPDANVPTSIRHSGIPVAHRPVADLRPMLETWLAEHADGTACVIGVPPVDADALPATPRVRSSTPELAKGLEFDLVVVVDPASFGDGVTGAVDRYVAMTRATGRLVVLT
ncbi:RNA polymerase recycling motor ATPase HelR [Solwaraspora sp. WMMA2101]|uniref:RNA polymerase recycling motor ATPase HelR n=1 Tax=Solwaraspora sp. WMMA2101 TaxID=3404124 RepID=UPI003B92BE2D